MKIFTDRVESQKNFWASYDELIKNGSTIISFYGAGKFFLEPTLQKILS